MSKCVECDTFSLQCFDTVGRPEKHPACEKLGVGFVGGDDLTGVLLVL